VNAYRYKCRPPLFGYTLLLFFTAATPSHSQDRPASIHGTVTNAGTGEGLRKAYLRLVSSTGSAYSAVTSAVTPAVTNDQGAFAIENIAPGSYRLEAERAGFLTADYGRQPGSEQASMLLRLSAGQSLTGIEIKLVPQASVSGRVFDSDGDPWPHAFVNLYRSVWRKGRRQIELAESSDFTGVDDRGEFRIFALAPGRYYVLAEPSAEWEKEHHPDVDNQPAIRQQPTWYPSASDAASSIPITLAAGQQFTGLDFRLRARAGSRLRIRGKLSGMQGLSALRGESALGIWVQPAGDAGDAPKHGGTIRPDGSFEIAGVPSGAYEIFVAQGFAQTVVLGRTTVQVVDRDLENLSIELHAPQRLTGTVRIEGDTTLKPSALSLRLDTLDTLWPGGFTDLKDDGTFEFDQIGLGQYRVLVREKVRKQGYLKLLRYGNSESRDGLFSLNPGGAALELVFSTRGARISGSIVGPENAPRAANPQVVLMPDTTDVTRREYETRVGVFDQNGVFTVDAIPPGSYKLYALEKVPDGVWLEPEFLKEIESKGIPLDAAEDDVKTIQLALILKADTDRMLAKLGIE
jgi:hypothetical protein